MTRARPDPAKPDAQLVANSRARTGCILDGVSRLPRLRRAFAPAAHPRLVGRLANRIRSRACEDDHQDMIVVTGMTVV
jgi:hypothetical protein